MSIFPRVFAVLVALSFLLAACGGSEIPPTSAPPRATPTPTKKATVPAEPPAPTASPMPPTDVPEPTDLPPTQSPPEASTEELKNVAYVPDGDRKQVLDGYLPGGEGAPSPTLLLLHGGGGDKVLFASWARELAGQGYAVVAANRRDWPKHEYPVPMQDVFCAAAWIHANAAVHGFDVERFAVLGHSSGGTMAAMLGGVDDADAFVEGCPHPLPETGRVQGVIAFTGIFDYASPDHGVDMQDYFDEYFGGSADDTQAQRAEASAITWLDGTEPPFLLIHGLEDHNIDPVQSEAFAAALEEVGVEADLRLIAGADHGDVIKDPQALEAVDAFLARLGEEASAGAAEGAAAGVAEEATAGAAEEATAGAAEEPVAAAEGARELRISIVYDNTVFEPGLRSAWGFAAYVEYGEHTILFDTGGNGGLLQSNMKKMGLDLETVEAIVLSHIHGDHTDGLAPLLKKGIQPTVYVPAAFPDEFKEEVRAYTELVEVHDAAEILPGMHSTGQLGTGIREQALAIETSEGLVVITGCAHPGIVKIVGSAGRLVEDDIALVVGGFHLGGMKESRVKSIINNLRDLGARQVSPTHCTGEEAIAIFAEEYGEGYVEGGVGQVYDVGGPAAGD